MDFFEIQCLPPDLVLVMGDRTLHKLFTPMYIYICVYVCLHVCVYYLCGKVFVSVYRLVGV